MKRFRVRFRKFYRYFVRAYFVGTIFTMAMWFYSFNESVSIPFLETDFPRNAMDLAIRLLGFGFANILIASVFGLVILPILNIPADLLLVGRALMRRWRETPAQEFHFKPWNSKH